MRQTRFRWLGLLLCVLLLCAGGAQAASPFPDVPRGIWYADAVNEMAAQGLVTGCSDGAFHPMEPITSAQFVTLAVRCASLSPKRGQTGHWAAGNLQAALDAGWYDWDEIPPTGEKFELPISRQLAVKILMRALLPDVRGDYNTESAKIKDFSALSGRYYEPVLAAYAAGICTGGTDGTFHPESSLTRAEACLLFYRALARTEGTPVPAPQPSASAQPSPSPRPTPAPEPLETVRGGVKENGWLRVDGTRLCNEAGEPVVLRGMSTHGLQWYGQYSCAQSIRNTADAGANVFRLAMYTGENGYLSQPEEMKKRLFAAADEAIRQDMYVILDWHILSDGNPMSHADEAAAFFTEAARRYKDSPAVIYEICNEPNGNISWSGNVKPYAEKVVAAIRAQSPKGIILIGSPTWSQDLHLAAADPVKGENLMYTLHFYAGTHGKELRDRIDGAMAAGLAVFVSEWGTSRADGNGGVFLDAAGTWLDFLDARGISWCNWSLCDKGETSAALKPGTPADRAWTRNDLSESGRFVFSRFTS